jgi:hypothetical protein
MTTCLCDNVLNHCHNDSIHCDNGERHCDKDIYPVLTRPPPNNPYFTTCPSVAVACAWLLTWPYPVNDAKRKSWKAFHMECHARLIKNSDDVTLPGEQLAYYSNPAALWKGELSHLAWCGGVYADKERFSALKLVRSDKDGHMRQYLPLVTVGASWKTTFRCGVSLCDNEYSHCHNGTIHCHNTIIHCDNETTHCHNETTHCDNETTHCDNETTHCDNGLSPF